MKNEDGNQLSRNRGTADVDSRHSLLSKARTCSFSVSLLDFVVSMRSCFIVNWRVHLQTINYFPSHAFPQKAV